MKNKLDKVLSSFTALLMVVMVIMCCWQVFTRFILKDASKISEEFLRYALIWVTMLGAPYAYGKEKHLAIILFTRTFDKRGKILNKLFIEGIVIFLSIFVLIMGGIKVIINSIGQTSPALNLPMQYVYLSLPVCGVLIIIYSILNIGERLKEYKEWKEGGSAL